jgi:hypothetical protein
MKYFGKKVSCSSQGFVHTLSVLAVTHSGQCYTQFTVANYDRKIKS